MAERQSTSPSIAICASVIHSEVVTNIALALNVDYAWLENLMLSFELNASASNSFSIAAGTANGFCFQALRNSEYFDRL